MKITIAKPDLETALQIVNIVVSSGGNDLSTHYLFRRTEDGAEVLAYSNRTFASAPLLCRVEDDDGPDMFTAAAWRLTRWLSGVRDGALTICLAEDNGSRNVTLRGARASIRCPTLDPSKFPFWDKGFTNAEDVGSGPPAVLASVIGHAAKFTSPEDTLRPEYAQIEAREGAVWSSDQNAVSLVEIGAFANLGIRLNTKDVSNVAKFLAVQDTQAGDVRILQNDNAAFFVRHDGALLGAARPPTPFPSINIRWDAEPPTKLEIPSEDIQAGLLQISAAATKDDVFVHFSLRDGVLIASMNAEGGGTSEYPITNAVVHNPESLEEGGFTVSYQYLQSLMSTFDLDTLQLGVHRLGAGGYLSFRHVGAAPAEGVEPNTYRTIIAWKIAA